jgi:hypothetical protein
MTDIAQELRERSLRAEQAGEPITLLDDAADEIELGHIPRVGDTDPD